MISLLTILIFVCSSTYSLAESYQSKNVSYKFCRQNDCKAIYANVLSKSSLDSRLYFFDGNIEKLEFKKLILDSKTGEAILLSKSDGFKLIEL